MFYHTLLQMVLHFFISAPQRLECFPFLCRTPWWWPSPLAGWRWTSLQFTLKTGKDLLSFSAQRVTNTSTSSTVAQTRSRQWLNFTSLLTFSKKLITSVEMPGAYRMVANLRTFVWTFCFLFHSGHRQLRKSKKNEIALVTISVAKQRVPITSGQMVVTEIYFWDEVNHLLYFRY